MTKETWVWFHAHTFRDSSIIPLPIHLFSGSERKSENWTHKHIHAHSHSLALFTLHTDSLFLLAQWVKMRACFCNWERVLVIDARITRNRWSDCSARSCSCCSYFTVDTLHDRKYWKACLGVLFLVSVCQSALLALFLSIPLNFFSFLFLFLFFFFTDTQHLMACFIFLSRFLSSEMGGKMEKQCFHVLLTTPGCPLCCQVSLIGP